MTTPQLFEQLIEELGISDLPQEEQAAMAANAFQTLQMRVGRRLGEEMGEAKLAEFNRLVEQSGDEAAQQRLEELFPNYENIVREEIEGLGQELKSILGDDDWHKKD